MVLIEGIEFFGFRLLRAQAIEHGRIGWVYGDDDRIDIVGAGQIEPLAGTQAVGLGLERPPNMIGRL
jgi:hypothetical protein